jgi:replication factor A1
MAETTDKRIKKLSEASGMGEKEVKALIEKKKEEAAGLLTDHGAIYALEKEFGVAGEEEKAEYVPLSELKSGMNNANIFGVVREVRPVKKFQTEKRSGQFARLILADSGGEAPAVLWDKIAEIVQSDKIKPGTVIAIRNGYTRDSLNKTPEVHVGGLSRIIIDPKNVDAALLKGLPKFAENLRKIGELKEGDIATVQGRALYLYPKSEFQRQDGRKGQRSSLIAEDETGKIRIVLWDSNADSIEKFSEGSVVKVEGGQVRGGQRGLELHVGSRGRILPSDAKMNLPAPQLVEVKIYKVAELQPALQSVALSGRVVRVLPVKEFNSGGRIGKLASVILADETGMTRAVFWGEKAEELKDLEQGTVITLKNGYTKQSMNGDIEVHISSRGSMAVSQGGAGMPEVSALISKHATGKKIADLGPEDRNIKITGRIEDVDENPMVFEICAECGARVENVAGEWMCDVCGETTPAYGMVVSCGFTDGSGDIRAVFYRDVAEQLTGLSVEEALNMIGQSGNEAEPINTIREELAGKKFELVGNIRYNDYQDRLELMVSSLTPIGGEKVSRSAPKKSASKKGAIPEDVPKEVLSDEDIEVEEIKLDE